MEYYSEEEAFNDFYRSNILMIRYLSEKFNDHPDVLSLIKYSLEQAILMYPNYTITEYKKTLSNTFDNIYGSFKRSDLPSYIRNVFAHESSNISKNNESENIMRKLENDELIDLTKFVACIIYSRLKSHEKYSGKSRFDSRDFAFRRSLYFHPISKDIFSHKTPLYFSGKVLDVTMRTSKNGNPYARIYVNYDTERSFFAVVRSWLYYKVYDGLKLLNGANVSFQGTVIKDTFTDSLALDVHGFTINLFDLFVKYPDPTR